MSDVETLLTRSMTDAVAGVELDPSLISRTRAGVVGRRRRRRLQAGATVGLLVAALVAGAIVFAHHSSEPQSLQIGNDRTAPPSGDVTVPKRALHTDILDAYTLLHRLGFRVELTRQMSISSLVLPSATLTPAAGTVVPRGSVIEITPGFAAIGSPATDRSNPHYVVPNFAGLPLTDAINWAEQHDMFWSVPKLPALPASTAPHLFDAYRIVGQEPSPQSTIVQGIRVGQGFRPTPLTLTVVTGPPQ
jgi:hypothetical protein